MKHHIFQKPAQSEGCFVFFVSVLSSCLNSKKTSLLGFSKNVGGNVTSVCAAEKETSCRGKRLPESELGVNTYVYLPLPSPKQSNLSRNTMQQLKTNGSFIMDSLIKPGFTSA